MLVTGVVNLYTYGGRFESAKGAMLSAGVRTRIIQRGIMVPPKIVVSEEIEPSKIDCVFLKDSGLWLCGVGHLALVRFESNCGRTFLVEKVSLTKPLEGDYEIAASLSGDPAWEVEPNQQGALTCQ